MPFHSINPTTPFIDATGEVPFKRKGSFKWDRLDKGWTIQVKGDQNPFPPF